MTVLDGIEGRDVAIDCDVVVVGSGAGGATAAARLAEGGLHVALVEAAIRMQRDHDLETLDLNITEIMVMINDEPDWDPDATILTDEYNPANLMNTQD